MFMYSYWKLILVPIHQSSLTFTTNLFYIKKAKVVSICNAFMLLVYGKSVEV